MMMTRRTTRTTSSSTRTTSTILATLLPFAVYLLRPSNAFTSPQRHFRHPVPHIKRNPTYNPLLQRQQKLQQDGRPSSTTSISLLGFIPGIELSDLLYDDTSSAFDAWEWTANLGAPAALVAGAVLVTLSETREAMAPTKNDRTWVRMLKQWCRLLLLSSFALEVVSIFVSTVTGSVLLSHGNQVAKKAVGYTSALGLLRHHHEFEYLTIQITFLQGLMNWLLAVAIEMIIPKEGEKTSARRMNHCLASSLISLIFWILAFYNHHLSFYSDYAGMLRRYIVLFGRKYLFCSFRPMSVLYLPSSIFSMVLGWRAFKTEPDLDED